jgi:hypothetical protein
MIDCGGFSGLLAARVNNAYSKGISRSFVFFSLRKCSRNKNAVASCNSFVVRLQYARWDACIYTKPSYSDSADTIVSSRLLPSWKIVSFDSYARWRRGLVVAYLELLHVE